MNADELRGYIMGFIFCKYLSEKVKIFAHEVLKQDKIKFREVTLKTDDAKEFLDAIKEEVLEKLGCCFLKPEELFTEVAQRGMSDTLKADPSKLMKVRPIHPRRLTKDPNQSPAKYHGDG